RLAAALRGLGELDLEVVDLGAHGLGVGLEFGRSGVELGLQDGHGVACVCQRTGARGYTRRVGRGSPGRSQIVPQGLSCWQTHGMATETPDLLHGPALTPIALVRAMTWAYRARGMDPSAALSQAQIPPSKLSD